MATMSNMKALSPRPPSCRVPQDDDLFVVICTRCWTQDKADDAQDEDESKGQDEKTDKEKKDGGEGEAEGNDEEGKDEVDDGEGPVNDDLEDNYEDKPMGVEASVDTGECYLHPCRRS